MILSRVLSETYTDQLNSIGSSMTRDAFRAGDITVDIIEQVEVEKRKISQGVSELGNGDADALMGIGRMEIYAFVADRIYKSTSMVRKYVAVCEYFPEKERFPDLPFSHHNFAMGYKGHEGEILEASSRYLGNRGKPPSLAWLKNNLGNVISDPEQAEQVDAIQDMEEAELDMDAEPATLNGEDNPRAPTTAYYLLTRLERVLEMIEKAVAKLRVETDRSERIKALIQELTKELNDLYMEAEKNTEIDLETETDLTAEELQELLEDVPSLT